MTRFAAVVLAASRPHDPLARACGVSHKAVVRVGGLPMIRRVADALRGSRSVGRMAVCAEDRALLEHARASPGEELGFVPNESTPSRSVLGVAEQWAQPFPFLVTTADHALLSSEMVDFFCDAALRTGADLVVALAPASVILASYPEAQRTFLRFRDGRYSGCNLFALLGPRALDAVRFWTRAERHRKRPWKVIATFGPVSLLMFTLGRLTLEDAMRRASRLLGVEVAAVVLPYAEAAIDVDKVADLALAEDILRRRSAMFGGAGDS